MSSSAESQRFDATAAAQQMLALEAAEPLPAPATPFPAQSAPETAPAPAAWPPGEIPGTLTDRGNAKLFVRLYRDRFRHVEGLGWYSWDGYRWKRTGGEKAALWAAGEMAEEIPDTDPRGLFSDRELHHHKKRTMSTTGMKALLTQAKASPDLSLDPDTLDGDPYALCTPDGVVDLRNGRIRKPDPTRDFHSRATSVAPQNMPTPRWHRFLDDTFGEDAEGREMIDFLHLLLGYSITGDVGAQVLPFLHGQGKNGKSVLLDVMIQILGDYADAAPPTNCGSWATTDPRSPPAASRSGAASACCPSNGSSPTSGRSTTSPWNSSRTKAPASCTGSPKAPAATSPPATPSPARTASASPPPPTRTPRTTSAAS